MGQWVMGHSFDGSHGSWVTARDPFAALLLRPIQQGSGAIIPNIATIIILDVLNAKVALIIKKTKL